MLRKSVFTVFRMEERVNSDNLMVIIAKLNMASRGLTTRQLEQITLEELPRATFYRTFKIVKDEGYVASQVGAGNKVVWVLTEKGKNFSVQYFEELARKHTDANKETLIKALEIIKNNSEKKVKPASILKKLNQDMQTTLILFFLANQKQVGRTISLDVKFKLNKKELDKLINGLKATTS